MLYTQLIEQAKQLVVTRDDITGKLYLNPAYRFILHDNQLVADNVADFPFVTDDIIAQNLMLYVQNENDKLNKGILLTEWAYEAINNVVQPAITDGQNEFIKNVMQYMKLNDTLKDKQAQLNKKEQTLQQKSKIQNIIPGMTFTKRTP